RAIVSVPSGAMIREVFTPLSDHRVAVGYGITRRPRVGADNEPAYGAKHDCFESARLWAGAEARRHQVRAAKKSADDHKGKDYCDVSQERLCMHAVTYCFAGIIDRLIFGSVKNLSRSATEQK